MFMNPFLQMMEMQSNIADQFSAMVFRSLDMQRTQRAFVRDMMFMPYTHMRVAISKYAVPPVFADNIKTHHHATFSDNAFDVSRVWPLKLDAPVVAVKPMVGAPYCDVMAMQDAENEGMGAAILSVSAAAQKAFDYEASCNVDAAVIDENACVEQKTYSIKNWFSKEAVATEQDTTCVGGENRRIYTPFGSTPNAPSAKAVLERYKAKKNSKSKTRNKAEKQSA